MTSPVITVGPDAATQQVAQTLARHQISAVPVVGPQGALLGIVSEVDLLGKPGATAREVMTTAVVTATVDSPVDDIRHLLINRRIRRVPIMEAGRLVGIVSLRDVLAMIATEWVCRVCGEPARGDHPPSRCPRCHAAAEQFDLQEQPPGA